MVIERRTLRAQVRDELLARMRSGRITPGEGVNEIQLAAELGVSRTPLREALIALESEGQMVSENGKGFRFVRMRARELAELGPIIATLEGLAIDLSPVDRVREIAVELLRLAEEFPDSVARHGLVNHRDDEWHTLMISACPNERLLSTITGLRLAVHRYESLLVSDEDMVSRTAVEHVAIAERLCSGDLAGAKVALMENWTHGIERLVAASGRSLD